MVGDVLGKYHPHGDTSAYDALVRMAQNFSMRYQLVDGQGNFGSVDGDPPAAYRYTECRMTALASELLADIDTRDRGFRRLTTTASEKEPVVLPTRVPNLLINGSAGIAVGMATNIPPHNLGEVVNRVYRAHRRSGTSASRHLMQIIPGPDFPTAGIINGAAEIAQAYLTGRGRVYDACPHARSRKTTKVAQAIIITELPFQVNKARLLERIAELVREKQSRASPPMACATSPTRTACAWSSSYKRGEVADVVLNKLFKHTPMETVFGMNMVASAQDGQPKLFSLKEMLRSVRAAIGAKWSHVAPCYDLRKARERAHMLEGQAVALANIDESHRGHQGIADTGRSQSCVDEPVVGLRCRAGDAASGPAACVPAVDGLSAEFGLVEGGYRLSDVQAQAIFGDALEPPDRSRAGQDHRRVPGAAGGDRRLERHPGSSRAPAAGDSHRAGRRQGQGTPNPRRTQINFDHSDPTLGRSDRTAGRGGHAVAWRLCEVAARHRTIRRSVVAVAASPPLR